MDGPAEAQGPAKERAEKLLRLARKWFPDLTPAEQTFLRKTVAGKEADFSAGSKEDNKPSNAEDWDEGRRLRSQVIVWLCTDPEASALVTHRGVQVKGARVDGALDLSFAQMRFPLALFRSSLADGIDLRYVKIPALNLRGSHSGPINAGGMKVGGGVFLQEGFKAEGEVRLFGAEIGGQLSCRNGHFSNPKGDALSAERIKVGDHVFLDDGFQAKGRIYLLGATVSGGLEWTGVDSPRDAIMDLRDAHIGTLHDDPESWPAKGKLLLDGLVYERIFEHAPTDADTRAKWLRLQPSFLPQPYEQLAKTLRDGGHEKEARIILIQKQEGRAAVLSRGGRILHWLFGLTVGYGYRPWRALLWGIGIIVLGAGLFCLGSYKGVMCQTKLMERVVTAGAKEDSVSSDYPKFRPLVYSLDLFIPLINLRQVDCWAPNANKEVELSISKNRMIPLARFLIGYSTAHTLLGWLITTLFIVSVTGLLKR